MVTKDNARQLFEWTRKMQEELDKHKDLLGPVTFEIPEFWDADEMFQDLGGVADDYLYQYTGLRLVFLYTGQIVEWGLDAALNTYIDQSPQDFFTSQVFK